MRPFLLHLRSHQCCHGYLEKNDYMITSYFNSYLQQIPSPTSLNIKKQKHSVLPLDWKWIVNSDVEEKSLFDFMAIKINTTFLTLYNHSYCF